MDLAAWGLPAANERKAGGVIPALANHLDLDFERVATCCLQPVRDLPADVWPGMTEYEAIQRMMRSRKPRRTIGFLTSTFSNKYSEMLLSGAIDAARGSDVNLICFEAGTVHSPNADAPHQVLCDLVSPATLDGIVIWSQGMDTFVSPHDMRDFLHCHNLDRLPIVSIGAVEDVPSVVWDLAGGARQVVGHLIEQHHCRRIAYIRGPQMQAAAEELYRGYLEALAAHGIPFEPGLVTPSNAWGDTSGRAAIRVLLDERNVRFDALVGADEEVTAAMELLQKRGFHVPGDLAVVGYNDLDTARLAAPPLTTVWRPIGGAAHRALELLLNILDGKTIPQRVILQTKTVLRRSCGCMLASILDAAPEVKTMIAAASDLPFKTALPARRGQILAELERSLQAIGQNEMRNELPDLMDRFVAEIAGDIPKGFLLSLERVLQRVVVRHKDVSAWDDIISAWRQSMLPVLLTEQQALLRAENLWHQARVLIDTTAEQTRANRARQAMRRAGALHELGNALIATFDVAELMGILTRNLPQIGIPSCYICLYEDPQRPTGWARLILAHDEGRPMAEEAADGRFLSSQLLPEGLWPRARQYVMLVEPLCFGAEQLGFALFELGPRDGSIYAGLRVQISGALRGAMLTSHNTRLYEEAVAARKAAEQADRLKSRFLSTVSHELRTPLSLILGTIEMLLPSDARHADPLSAVYQRDLRAIQASAQHLARLIGDVLDLASSQAGELRLAAEPLDLTRLLGEVALLAEPMAREKGLGWRIEVPQILPAVWGDRTRLQQVTLNLISNAVKFTERGAVALRAETSGAAVMISVSDTGIGIPVGEQDTIFDEFRQSERTVRRGYVGMGLGLAISRRIVELHGGTIGVRSTGAEGGGSTFFFTLPILAEPLHSPALADQRARAVLLLTQQPEAAAGVRRQLTARGFEVVELAISKHPDWLAQIAASPPGAIILDFDPAAERGWELMQQLKQLPGARDIPVVFFSIVESQAQGVILELDCLAKPVGVEAVTEALARYGFDDAACKGGRTILVVDDESQVLDMHARIVQLHVPNCQVLKAHNGREALALLEQRSVDLVLLDLVMPQGDGFTVLEAMRSSERACHIPVIILTGQSLKREEMTRLQHGVAAVLGKKLFSAAEVLAHIEAALNRNKRLGSEAQRIARQVMAFIHEHYAEPISRPALADALAVNERYLTRCFRQEMGITPMTYLNRYRVKQARRLLEQGQLSVTDVALQVGFSDSSYFGRVFQDEVGMSPSLYKREYR